MEEIYQKTESLNNDLTIIVNSCDYYEDAWYPFFKLLKEQWPECEKYKIILNTETKKFDCDFLNVCTICTGSDLPWTERVKVILKHVTTSNVLMFLEDYFILKPVDQSLFDEILNAFAEDRKIGVAYFKNYDKLKEAPKQSVEYNDYFRYLSKHYFYRVCLSLSLWKTEYLKKMLFISGTPWYFENSSRTVSIMLNHKYIPVFLENDIPVVFAVNHNKYGITKKKWLFDNIKLFEEYSIQVDFEKMGLHEETFDITKCNETAPKEAVKIKKRSHGVRRLLWYIKRNFKFCKRVLHIYPSFYRYCKQIDNEDLLLKNNRV